MRRLLVSNLRNVRSEREPGTDLDVSRQISLRVRISKGRCCAGRRRQIEAGEVDPVKRVDRFDTELDLHALADPEILSKARIKFLEVLIPEIV